jgi:hypothetical protein
MMCFYVTAARFREDEDRLPVETVDDVAAVGLVQNGEHMDLQSVPHRMTGESHLTDVDGEHILLLRVIA